MLKNCEHYLIEEPTTDCLESTLNLLLEIARDLLKIVSEETNSDYEIIEENEKSFSKLNKRFCGQITNLVSVLDKGVFLNRFFRSKCFFY